MNCEKVVTGQGVEMGWVGGLPRAEERLLSVCQEKTDRGDAESRLERGGRLPTDDSAALPPGPRIPNESVRRRERPGSVARHDRRP